ncbi:MAG: hypothetical protein ABI700_00705 [Chloroflexota bacterium]
MTPWYQFDGPDDDDERGDEIELHEKAALDTVKALVALAATKSDKTLMVGASLRKIGTVATSHAQTIALRSMTVRKGERL